MLMDRQIDTMRAYLTMENMFQARAVLAALRAICFAYRDMPGRKNVVLFSEGFLYSADARPDMEAVADAANRANVSIYVLTHKGSKSIPMEVVAGRPIQLRRRSPLLERLAQTSGSMVARQSSTRSKRRGT
jgi:hypothetical protein